METLILNMARVGGTDKIRTQDLYFVHFLFKEEQQSPGIPFPPGWTNIFVARALDFPPNWAPWVGSIATVHWLASAAQLISG